MRKSLRGLSTEPSPQLWLQPHSADSVLPPRVKGPLWTLARMVSHLMLTTE